MIELCLGEREKGDWGLLWGAGGAEKGDRGTPLGG